jgi:predicted lysophospholipase L1 biosynthesis ABC-type transport system permease subunit
MNALLRRVAVLLLLPALAHAYRLTASDGLAVVLVGGIAFWLLLLGLVLASFRWPLARWLLFWQVPAVVGLSAFIRTSVKESASVPPGLVLLLLLSLYLTGRTLMRQRHQSPRRALGLLTVLVGSGALLAALLN